MRLQRCSVLTSSSKFRATLARCLGSDLSESTELQGSHHRTCDTWTFCWRRRGRSSCLERTDFLLKIRSRSRLPIRLAVPGEHQPPATHYRLGDWGGSFGTARPPAAGTRKSGELDAGRNSMVKSAAHAAIPTQNCRHCLQVPAVQLDGFQFAAGEKAKRTAVR